jgi:hypothetical protein
VGNGPAEPEGEDAVAIMDKNAASAPWGRRFQALFSDRPLNHKQISLICDETNGEPAKAG